jgi:hypothetical protein
MRLILEPAALYQISAGVLHLFDNALDGGASKPRAIDI